MKLMRVLQLMILVSCLNGCASRAPIPSEYTWVHPIYIHEDTARFLSEHSKELPKGLIEDLNQIDKFNQKCREILGSK